MLHMAPHVFYYKWRPSIRPQFGMSLNPSFTKSDEQYSGAFNINALNRIAVWGFPFHPEPSAGFRVNIFQNANSISTKRFSRAAVSHPSMHWTVPLAHSAVISKGPPERRWSATFL